MSDAMDKAFKAGVLFSKVRKVRENKSAERVNLYAYRVANDLDIWTGEPRHATDIANDNRKDIMDNEVA